MYSACVCLSICQYSTYKFLPDVSPDTPSQVFAPPREATSGPLSLCALLNMWEVEQSSRPVLFLLEAVNRQLLLKYSKE